MLCSTSRMRIPDARIDIAVVAHRHFEIEPIVRRIADRLARVEGAARGASDIAAGAECARQSRRQIAGGDGAVLERGGAVVNRDQLGEAAAHGLEQLANAAAPPGARSSATPPGTMRSIIKRWPKQACAARRVRSRNMPHCDMQISENEASLQIAPISPK